MHLNTDDLSMYIQLLGNRNNFDWLGKEDIQNKISKLFSFLSKPDALKVIKLIHTKTTSTNISASFVAKMTGLTDEIATEILDEVCSIGLCTKNVAHIKDKEITIYMSNGSGKILSLVRERVLCYNQKQNKCSDSFYFRMKRQEKSVERRCTGWGRRVLVLILPLI